MAAPVATAAIKRQRTNIVGPGLKLKPTIDRAVLGMSQEQAEAWQRHTLAEFQLWASRKQACDATGVNNFYALQQLIALSWPMSGDCFALIQRDRATKLMPYSLRIHLIEADRVRTPDHIASGQDIFMPSQTTVKLSSGNVIHDGVEVNPNGAVVAYYIANGYPDEDMLRKAPKPARVEAYGALTGLPNILHIMDAERPEQYRGVPYLAQAIEPLLQMRRYTEAEITAAIVQSFFTAFVKTEAGTDDMPANETVPEGEQQLSKDPNEYEVGPGTVNMLEPGEDVTFGSPTHPNTGFDTFMRALCEQVGACLEIPADLLMMSFNSSYSASRAALMEAWKGFRMRREWLINDFCQPVYEVWLTEAVARGRISAPGFLTDPVIRQAYLRAEWIGPSQGQLDPVKEINAAVTAIEHGLSTGEAESIRLNGSDFASNVDKLAVENQKLRAANGGNPPGVPQTPPETGENEEEE